VAEMTSKSAEPITACPESARPSAQSARAPALSQLGRLPLLLLCLLVP
jgi:hypothetical protein